MKDQLTDKEIVEKVSHRYNLRNDLYQLTNLHFDVNDSTYFEEVLVRYVRLIERSKLNDAEYYFNQGQQRGWITISGGE